MKRTVIIILAAILLCQVAEAIQPKRGYRGFFEWSNSMRHDNFGVVGFNGNIIMERQRSFYTGFTTSHGYQINPLFFIGAGLGMEHCGNVDNWVAPIFLEGRIDLTFGKFTPFGDLRLGANLAEGAGVYVSPTVGYRFNWGSKMGVNIGAGLTLAGYTAEYYEGTWAGDLYYVGTKHHIRPYFSFRVGIDF